MDVKNDFLPSPNLPTSTTINIKYFLSSHHSKRLCGLPEKQSSFLCLFIDHSLFPNRSLFPFKVCFLFHFFYFSFYSFNLRSILYRSYEFCVNLCLFGCFLVWIVSVITWNKVKILNSKSNPFTMEMFGIHAIGMLFECLFWTYWSWSYCMMILL